VEESSSSGKKKSKKKEGDGGKKKKAKKTKESAKEKKGKGKQKSSSSADASDNDDDDDYDDGDYFDDGEGGDDSEGAPIMPLSLSFHAAADRTHSPMPSYTTNARRTRAVDYISGGDYSDDEVNAGLGWEEAEPEYSPSKDMFKIISRNVQCLLSVR
jgi:hypothetical protein